MSSSSSHAPTRTSTGACRWSPLPHDRGVRSARHRRTIPVAGQVMQIGGFAGIRLDMSDFPTRHNYGLALWQSKIEPIMADWVGELGVPIHRGRSVERFVQDGTGVDVELSDGQSLRAEYLVGCDGGRSVIRKTAGIEFPGWIRRQLHARRGRDGRRAPGRHATRGRRYRSRQPGWQPLGRTGSCSRSGWSSTTANPRCRISARRSSLSKGRTTECTARPGSPGSPT